MVMSSIAYFFLHVISNRPNLSHCYPSHSPENNRHLALRHNDFMVEVNITFFNLKLKQLLDELYRTPSDYDLGETSQIIKLDRTASICRQSHVAFQHLVRRIAQQMIKYHFPRNMQTFLERFLDETKLSWENEKFFRLYEEELINYLWICDAVRANDGASNVVEDCLKELRGQNYENFVILCTHFPKFTYMLYST